MTDNTERVEVRGEYLADACVALEAAFGENHQSTERERSNG